MNEVLVRKIQLRSPFTLKRIPFLARFHRAASKQRVSRKAQLLVKAPLEKMFQWYYRIAPPATGELEFVTPEGRRTIIFDARNLAFDIFYADLFVGNYEDETAVLLDAFLPENGCLYDIGSNWGYFSLYAASRGGDARIHAFEPIPSTYADLRSCVEQAGLTTKIQCHNVAVSDRCGDATFQVPFHSATAQAGGGSSIGREVKVEARTVDSMGLELPAFMKIDAEGHEAAVLRGSLEMLRKAKPFVMFENKLYRHVPEETLQPMQLLTGLGYYLFIPTLLRTCKSATYYVNCGYQIDTGQTQKIEREDTLALVACEPDMRFLLPNYLNIFACHRDRIGEVQAKFQGVS